MFINAHGVAWETDEKYACWHLGEVIGGADDVLAAVERGLADPSARVAKQRVALADAVGNNFDGAAQRGADVVLSYLERAAA